MNLNTVAGMLVVGWYVLASLLNIVLITVIATAMVRLNTKLDDLTRRIDPLLNTGDQFLQIATQKITSIGDTTENILTHGELIASLAEKKSQSTGKIIQKTILSPFININSVLYGIQYGFFTFGKLQSRQKNTPMQSPERGYTKNVEQ